MIQAAFKDTMADIERQMEARVRGKDDEGFQRDEDRVTGNLVYAAFTHRVTRPVGGSLIRTTTFTPSSLTPRTMKSRRAGRQSRNIKRDAPFYEAAFNARLGKSLVSRRIRNPPDGSQL